MWEEIIAVALDVAEAVITYKAGKKGAGSPADAAEDHSGQDGLENAYVNAIIYK